MPPRVPPPPDGLCGQCDLWWVPQAMLDQPDFWRDRRLNKISHKGALCGYDQIPNRNPGHQGSGELPWLTVSIFVVTRCCWEKTICRCLCIEVHRERKTRSLFLVFLGLHPMYTFYFCWFNLYPFHYNKQ